MIAQLINFAVVMIVLWVFALKPLKKLMDERGATIAGGLENAEKQKAMFEEATKMLEENTLKLKAISIEEKKKLNKELEKLQNENKIHMEEDGKKWVEDTKKGMEAEKALIMQNAEKEVGALLIMLAQKAFGDAMDAKTQAKLVDEGIKNIK